ncbi:hypothetical protein Dsin_000706 [Dipteronia sinensis]|uniref:RNase H type-1 domain-containing protein n=1 Tax=Dipteronia sinensis TaxID=43782 RepID=A0AAE0B3U4_9ROSI|nr:hypothetical protein Dsin_000706 [Dipteronia sinensis]
MEVLASATSLIRIEDSWPSRRGAKKKCGVVRDFGRWIDSSWVWNVDLRRPLFEWELHQWTCFMSALNCLIIRKHISDTVAWSHSRNGNFSVKSLCTSLEALPTNTDPSYNILWRVVWWLKFHGKGSTIPVSTMLLNLHESCVNYSKPKTANLPQWVPPYLGDLKFKVDCSASGKSGLTGIRGVLRDSTGNPLCIFLAFLGILESNSAKILAIHKACELCASKPSLADRTINIISDSKVSVAWINNSDDIRSFNHVSRIYDIRGFLH